MLWWLLCVFEVQVNQNIRCEATLNIIHILVQMYLSTLAVSVTDIKVIFLQIIIAEINILSMEWYYSKTSEEC